MKENKELNFKKLTPVDNVNLSTYKQAIDFAINSVDINNIAISGAYGSGKSSVIESYKKQDSKNKYLTISLAHFESDDKDIENVEKALEKKIINQLVHKVPAEKIPLTNFKLKSNIDDKSIWCTTVVIIAFCLLSLYVAFFSNIVEYINSYAPILAFLNCRVLQIIAGIVCVFLFSFGLKNIIKIFKSKTILKRLKIKDAEIEMDDEEKDASYFDKYLNDVLYVFESCEENIFVFEDLDRFNSVVIFERLREINNLVNCKLQNGDNAQKKNVKFFYLLRDDVFTSKDRTKFFDFLIPIVPVIDGSNSYEKILDFFTEDELEKQFLSDLSLYIDDMRLLENIYNEYRIYENELDESIANPNKLLALIVYKNIFPKDFANLQLGRSFVNAVFNTKNDLIENSILSIDNEINKKKEFLELVKSEVLKSKTELEILFKNDPTKNNRFGYYNQKLTSSAEQEKKDRLAAIDRKLTDSNIELTIQKEIESFEKKKNKIKTANIKELLNDANENIAFGAIYDNGIEKATNFNEIKGDYYFGLLKYLIRYGYIDEYYSDYITYFYANSITLQDKKFLQSIIERKPLDYTYEISKPNSFIERIRLTDFENPVVLNYELLTFLINSKLYQQQLDKILEQIKNDNCVEFIKGYLKKGVEKLKFVSLLNQKWPNAFNSSIKHVDDYEFVKQYSLLTLESLDDVNKDEINIDNCLTEYISNDPNYLNINLPFDGIIEKFKLINVKFKKIDIGECTGNIWNDVFTNDLYQINYDNINMIFQLYFAITDEKIFKHRNFEILSNNSKTPYYLYCIENINEYVGFYLDICDNLINDDEKFVIELLNNSDLKDEYKTEIVLAFNELVTDLSLVNDKEIRTQLVDNNKVDYSERNIACYISDEEELNDSQINFINSSNKTIDFTNLKLSDEESSKIFNLLVVCNELSDEKYVQALLSLNCVYETGFSIKGLNPSKINILINNKIVKMNAKALDFIRSNYEDALMNFIQINVQEYSDIIDGSNFDYDEMIEVLGWNIDVSIKNKLLSLNSSKISICDYSYDDETNYSIIKGNLYADEITALFEQYDRFGVKAKNAIFDLANQHLKIVLRKSDIALSLVKKLIEDNADANGLNLLLNNIDRFNFYEVVKYLSDFGYYKYNDLLDSSKRPRFDIDDANKRILDCLVSASFIYDYSENGGYYTVQRNKPRRNLLKKSK